MKKSNKGFSLVELIVVITILAILATIGFTSYSSYVIGARDTSRKTDLSVLNNSIKSLTLKGFNLISLVNTGTIDRSGSGEFYLGGVNLSLNSSYKAGEIDFSYLNDINQPLYDPKIKKSYVLGVYKSSYELASSLEETNSSYLISSYKKRTGTGTMLNLTGTIDAINKSITLLNPEDAIKIQIGDRIGTGGVNYFDITDIIENKIYLNSIDGLNIIDKIRLFKDDTSIIGNFPIGAGTGISCTNLSNLKANLCPLKTDINGLIPYSFN